MRKQSDDATTDTVGSPVRGPTITSTDPSQVEPGGAAVTVPGGAAADVDDLPATIARYRVTGRLGAGGMGVVYAARDPALDRAVAIKVVRRQLAGSELDQRLEREAQALARLDHPNVVTVYDAGVDGDRLYIVMQRVDGETLDERLDDPAAPRAAVLGWFLDAGRGLAAVHAAGLVHRDFKPANVLIDAGGVAKVTDFGLARLSNLVDPEADRATGSPDTPLTRSMTQGKTVGTPAYMAPEQFLGGPITAATDQFAFSVSVWEGLTGKRPFAGDTYDELRRAVATGAIEPPAVRLPRRVERALRRGLAVRVSERWPDLEALLAELAPSRRRRFGIGAIAAGALAAAFAGVLVISPLGRGDDPCAGVDRAVDAVWPGRMPGVAAALAAVTRAAPTDRDHAIAATLSYLNDRAARWRLGRRDACEATRVRHAQDRALMDRRVACLDRSLAGIAAAIDEISRASLVESVLRAPAVAAAGLDPDLCRGEQLERVPPQPAAPLELWRKALAIDAATAAGRAAAALAAGKQLAAEAERTGDNQLVAYLWSKIAVAGSDLSTADARDATRRAAQAAAAAGDDALAAEAWGRAAATAAHAGDLGAVDDLMAMARAAASRARDPDAALWIDGFTGMIAVERLEFDAAIATCRRVLDQATGKPRERIADFALECLTLALIRGERWPEAEPPARRLVARLTERNGAEHPNTIYARLKLATVHYHGDRPRAELEANAVTADLTRLFGPDSPHLMEALSIIANTEMELSGQATERSLHAARQALDIGERLLPADDAKLARLYWIWAAELTAIFDPISHKQITGRIGEARDAYQRAMAIYERRREDFEWAKLAMAMAQMDRDDHACARALGPLHQVANMADAGRLPAGMGDAARAETGVCQLAAGDPASAAATLAAAVAAFDKTDLESAAQYRLWWAEAEWKRGRRDEARRLAREVKSKLPADTDLRRAFHRQADDWYLDPKPGIRDD